MITCPLCQKNVLVVYTPGDLSRVLQPVPDDSQQDFNCPTFIPMSGNISWSHYYRQTNQGWYPHYGAIIPPFSVNWDEGPNIITAWHWPVPHLTKAPDKCHDRNGDFQEFVRIIHRFKNLRAFA